MNIKLVRPTIELKNEALNYRQEHFDNNELIINGSELFDKIDSYEDWLEKVKSVRLTGAFLVEHDILKMNDGRF